MLTRSRVCEVGSGCSGKESFDANSFSNVVAKEYGKGKPDQLKQDVFLDDRVGLGATVTYEASLFE